MGKIIGGEMFASLTFTYWLFPKKNRRDEKDDKSIFELSRTIETISRVNNASEIYC